MAMKKGLVIKKWTGIFGTAGRKKCLKTVNMKTPR